METYTMLRQFADSWAVVLFIMFLIGVVLFLFRPGNRKIHRDIADIPFRHEDRPATSDEPASGERNEKEAR